VSGDPFDLLGDILDGRFRVDAYVGEGDLSIVYKGHDLALDAPVTIKCLNVPETLDPDLARPVVESFDEASRLHERLSRGSPHIARSIAAGRTIAPRTGETVPYLVREWFDGESLGSNLARRRAEGHKGRSIDEAIALLDPAVNGIAFAHEHGIAHLAINPDNLFVAKLDGASSLKVLDFGAARTVDRTGARLTTDSPLTSGLQLLRPAYAAPEQLDRSTGKPGTWTDVYALALIMMEVLSDRVDTQGADTPALVERALDGQKRPTPQAHGLALPRGLDLVLTRAVSRIPAGRPRDARTFWREVEAGLREAAGTPMEIIEPGRVSLDAWPSQPPASALSGPALPLPSEPRAPELPLFDPEDPATVRGGWSSRRARAMFGGSAVLITAVLALLAMRQPTPTPGTERFPARVMPAATSVAAASAAPIPLPSTPPPIAAPTVAPHTASTAEQAPTAAIRSAATATMPPRGARVVATPLHTGRFSPVAARHALYDVGRKVARCRHGRYWGSGYATIVFANDGSVDHVLVDPPFSKTVAGKCVAETLSSASIPSFSGKPGSVRLRFNIARR
jgi:serine/threonine protein kinase